MNDDDLNLDDFHRYWATIDEQPIEAWERPHEWDLVDRTSQPRTANWLNPGDRRLLRALGFIID